MEGTEREIANIVERVKRCSLCKLCSMAVHGVAFRGTPKKDVVMFVGEAPGQKEDLIGKPFVGPSGQLLDRLLDKVGLSEFYITNLVKHIPRNGSKVRAPNADEIAVCSSYLEEEIRILRPKLIVALGSVAFKYLTGLDAIMTWKDKVIETQRGKVLVLPHPSYYLRKGLSEYPEVDVKALELALSGNASKEEDKVYYPLHLHTTYSIGDGYGTPSQYKDRFLELNIDSAAITDHGSLGGVVAWTQTLFPELKPILGEEIYLSEGPEKERKRYHVTVLVKNEIGWRNLLALHYISHNDYFYYVPRVPFSEFLKFQEGLIILTGCPATPFTEHEDWLEKLIEVKDNKDIFVEVQPLVKFRDRFEKMIKLAENYKLKVVMTNDVHFPRKEDSHSRDLVRQVIRSKENPFAEDIHYVLSFDEAKRKADEFGWPGEWLTATKEIASEIEFKLEPYKSFPLPEFHTTIEERAYPEPGREERWNLEIDRLKRKQYYNYIQLIRNILDIADEMGISYGPGRGSIGGSYVAYRLGIHKVDPFKYDLLFDRFLSESRMDVPDIDLDFEHIRQEDLISEIKKRFSESKVARVGSYSTWHEKSAYNDLKKIVKSSEVNLNVPKLVGQVRHRGMHAAGVLICSDDLHKYVPLERSSGQLITAWDRDSLDYMRVPKIDILGLKAVSILKEIMQMAGLEQLPLEFNDNKVYSEIFQKSKTLGIFQFGTDLMTGLGRFADCFEDLVLINALVRPGARDFSEKWIAMKTGKRKPYYPHKKIEEITKNTLGLILYQEQIMRVVNEVGGLSWEEAEKFRKVTAKTGNRKLLEDYKQKFIEGAIKNGLDQKTAETIYDTILDFAGYSFNKSHAVFYSMLSYWTAWLKLYYPVEFYLISLKYETDSDKIVKFISEIKGSGFKIENPDVNKSDVFFSYKDGAFHVGLSCIKGIGQGFAEAIVEHAPYRGLLEFIAKTSPNAGQFKALAAVGALDCFNMPRSYLYSNADIIVLGSVAFFGSKKVEWTKEQKKVMLDKYMF